MLNYKKRTLTDNENVLRDQRKDNQQLKMSDISKIEQEEDRNDRDPSHKQKDGSRVASDQVLTMGMDQRQIDSRFLDPLAVTQGPGGRMRSGSGSGFGSVPMMGMTQNPPYAMMPPGSINPVMQGMMLNHINPTTIHHQSNPSNPNYVINIQQTVDKDSIIVETNYNQKKFLFYDRNKNFLGGFSSHDFIRFITSHVSSNFLRGVDSDSVKPIIERYICKVTVVEKPSKRYIINMLNYFESPFMGNIETLIKFYTFIHEFEENNLQRELDALNTQESVKTKEIFNTMMYTLLNHILKIIAALTNKLTQNDPNTSKIRDSLLNYSVAIVYRLSKFVRTEIDVKVDELTVLNQDLLRIEGIRTGLSSKLDSIQRSIDKQNAEIDVVLRNVLMFQMATKSSPVKKDEPIPIKTKEDHTNNEDNDDLLKELAETLEKETLQSVEPSPEKSPKKSPSKTSDSSSTEKTTDKTTEKTKVSSEKVSSTADKSSIFVDNSESRRKTLLPPRSGSKTQSDSLRISELLDEVGKLKAISEKRTSDSHKKGSDKSDILFMDKRGRSSDKDKRSEVRPDVRSEADKNTTKSEKRSSERSQQTNSLSSGSAKSLSDILMLHGNVDYGADESENSFDADEDGTESQLKHLSTPSNPKLSVIDIE